MSYRNRLQMSEKQQKNCIKAIVFLCLMLVMLIVFAVSKYISNDILERSNREFVNEFNRSIALEVPKETVEEIRSIAPSYYFMTVDDWVYLYKFADKYDIKAFPEIKHNPRYESLVRDTKDIMDALYSIDDYIESNGISAEDASKILNKAFSTKSLDLVTLFSVEGY